MSKPFPRRGAADNNWSTDGEKNHRPVGRRSIDYPDHIFVDPNKKQNRQPKQSRHVSEKQKSRPKTASVENTTHQRTARNQKQPPREPAAAGSLEPPKSSLQNPKPGQKKNRQQLGQVTSAEGSLGRVSALMASGTLVSRILGLIRSALLTAVVGQSLAGDAFGYANTLPNFFFNLLSAGVLNAVLIPQITKAMKQKDGGENFTNRLITAALGLILVVTVVLTVFSPMLIKAFSGWPDTPQNRAVLHLAILFGYVCMPQIAFYGLYAVLGNVLNTRGRFAAFMWAPALANVVQIIGQVIFLILWGQQRDPGLWTPAMIWVLAGSTTLGIFLQGVCLINPLRKSGFNYRPAFGLKGMGSVSRMAMWTLLGITIQQAGGLFYSWVMNSVRQRAGNELVASVAAQQNAFLVFMLPHSLITVSVLTALFPALSKAWQSTKLREVRALVIKGLKLPAIAVIPLSLLVIALSRPIVEVIFVGLTDREADDLALILSLMCLGTLAFGVSTWQQRYCFASENGRAFMTMQTVLTLIQTMFALLALTIVPGRFSVLTIAAGQTIANIVVALTFLVMANSELNGIQLGEVFRFWARITVACLPSTAVTFIIGRWIFVRIPTWFGGVLACGVGAVMFLTLFLGSVKILHIKEINDAINPTVGKLKTFLKIRK